MVEKNHLNKKKRFLLSENIFSKNKGAPCNKFPLLIDRQARFQDSAHLKKLKAKILLIGGSVFTKSSFYLAPY